ncbi:MAG: DUF7683 domain-containing protein [Phycisphaerales bacterium]
MKPKTSNTTTWKRRWQQLHQRRQRLVNELRVVDDKLSVLADDAPATTAAVHYVLRWFDRKSDEMAGSAPLRGIHLATLQQLFGRSKADPMYDCYPVTARQTPRLQSCVDAPIQLDRYDYFVEADAI